MTDEKKGARTELLDHIKFPDQPTLLDVMGADKDWEREWQGMPEFVMGSTEPEQKITMNFSSFEDVVKFGELIGQPVTRKTDSLWFPKPDKYTAPKNFRYIDK